MSFVCVAISASFLHYGPHTASAQMTGGHIAVETMMCADLPSTCPCNANKLQVIASNALVCGASQTRASIMALPTIKPPIGVTLDQVLTYTRVHSVKVSLNYVNMPMQMQKDKII